MDARVGGCQTCPRVNKVRHWNAMAVALRHCPEAKAMAAFGDSRGDARSGCRQVQGYSGSSRAGIKPAVCLWLVQGFSSEPEVGHRALCLVAAIALSGEDRSGGRLPRFWSVRHVERRGNLAAWILHMRRAINRGRGSGEPALDLGVGRWA